MSLNSRGPSATGGARLPSIPVPPSSVDAETRRWMENVREWLEVRLGVRGDAGERAVTRRELDTDLTRLTAQLGGSTSDSTGTDLEGDLTRLTYRVTAIRRELEELQNRWLTAQQSPSGQAAAMLDTLTVPNPTNLASDVKPSQVVVSWDEPSPPLVFGSELRVGTTWDTATLLWRGVGTDYKHARPANGTYKVWLAHLAMRGAQLQYSATPVSVDITVDDTIDPGAGADAQLLTLSATGFAFVFADSLATTASSPDQIDFTANLQNVTGSVVWAATGYDSSDASTGAVTLTAQTATTARLTKSNFVDGLGTSVRYVKVTATLGALSDTMTIYRGDNGSNAVQVVLSNEAHTLPAASDGTVSSFSGSGTTIRVYEGTTELTFDDVGSASGTWRVSHVNSGISGMTKTDSGTYATYGDATAMSADIATMTYTIQGKSLAGNSFTIVKIQSFAKSKAGATGGTGTRGSLTLYSNSVSPTINLSGTTWPDDTTSPFGTNDNNALKIVWQALGNSAGSFVSNTVSHMRIGDTVTLVDAGGTTAITKYWAGSYWVDPGVVISGNLLVGGTISGGTNLNVTGYGIFEGATGYTVSDPIAGGTASKTVAVAANVLLGANIGVYAKSSSTNVGAVYGHHTGSGLGVLGYASSTGGTGVAGYGEYGLSGKTTGGASNVGVAGYAGNASDGSIGVRAVAVQTGNYALKIEGRTTTDAQIISTLATGTAPFSITSTTEVANLNVASLKGKTWASPDPIGATTPSTGAFTTLSATGRFTSTVSGTNVSMVLPIVTAKPTAIAGGVCIHNTLGLIVSDGTNWYGPSGGIVTV